jgi:hypothetical protein
MPMPLALPIFLKKWVKLRAWAWKGIMQDVYCLEIQDGLESETMQRKVAGSA